MPSQSSLVNILIVHVEYGLDLQHMFQVCIRGQQPSNSGTLPPNVQSLLQAYSLTVHSPVDRRDYSPFSGLARSSLC